MDVDNFLQLLSQDTPNGYEDEQWIKILNAIEIALGCRVFFKGVRRTESWVITYQSREAILELKVSGSTAYWQLFANVEEEPLASPVRKYLKRFPIARMSPNDDDVVTGTWDFWLPNESLIKAPLTSSGPLIRHTRTKWVSMLEHIN